MKSAMLAKIIMVKDLDEFLETWHHREIDRYLNLSASYLEDSDASYIDRIQTDVWACCYSDLQDVGFYTAALIAIVNGEVLRTRKRVAGEWTRVEVTEDYCRSRIETAQKNIQVVRDAFYAFLAHLELLNCIDSLLASESIKYIERAHASREKAKTAGGGVRRRKA